MPENETERRKEHLKVSTTGGIFCSFTVSPKP